MLIRGCFVAIIFICGLLMVGQDPLSAADPPSAGQAISSPIRPGPMAGSQGGPNSIQLIHALTDEEKAWLRAHPVIRVFQDPGWPPVEFANAQGDQLGITSDYLDLIEQRLGIRFERIRSLSWQQAYDRLKRWEIDMTTSVAVTPERLNFWAFTQPYMTIPIVIATLADVTYVGRLQELGGKKVAVVEGYAVTEWIVRDHPDIQLVKVPTTAQGLELLQQGQVFALIDNMLVVGYHLAKMKIANVKIAGETPYTNSQCMAVRKDWAILAQILQKALDSISEAERAGIYQKWVPIRYEHGFDYHLLRRVLAVFGLIVVGLVVWNWKLAREIRSRKAAEAARGKSEERLRLALDGATDGIWDWNLKTGRMYFSPRCATMLGYPVEAYPAIYDDWLQLLHPDDLALAQGAFDRVVTSQTPFRLEFRLKAKNGEWHWILGRGKVAEQDREGHPLRMAGSQTDITERKLAEKAQQRSEAQLALAIEGSGVGLWDWHIRTGQLVYNERWAQMIGYTLSELAPISCATRNRLTHPEDLEKSRQLLARHFEGQTTAYECEVRMKHKDGHWVWILDRGKVVQWAADAQPIRMTGTHLDITERKSLEDRFLQAQKMESVGRLAGGVAHDFNNMLAVIIGNADLALELLDPDQPLSAYLEEIQKAGQRSAELTRQLLAFARKQAIAPKVLDLNDTVVGMLKLIRRLIGEDIDLAWMPGANPWPVKIDPAQLDQVLANLCVNARDAITGVGKVTIETQNLTLDEAYCAEHAEVVPGDYVVTSVSDDGCGMDQELLTHLFEPFFTTKGLGKGTGLGLATVYGIVRQNEGLITVYSEPGQGTTFRIYLPRFQGQATALPAEPSVQEPIGRGQAVLLVEDEVVVLALVRQIMERWGFMVLGAETPTQALHLAQSHIGPIGLMISDVVMPEMNGRDLAARIATLYPNIQCLFMSGYTANVIAHRGILDQGVLFIQKPFSKQELAVKVNEALRQSARRS